VLETKLTNNGPLRESADKHSIYAMNTKTSHRLSSGLARPACPCKASSAGVSGPMNRCAMR